MSKSAGVNAKPLRHRFHVHDMAVPTAFFLLVFVLVASFSPKFVLSAQAESDWQHATALNGTPKYPAGFPHFDYVNPQAPKGGKARLATIGSFDTLNPVPDKGEIVSGIGLVYETLMVPSLDELPISATYGLLAEATSYPDDYSSVSFRLNPNAKWHDGVPVTPEDVVFSFNATITHSALQKQYYVNVVKAEKTGEREVTFTFDKPGNRELPKIMGEIAVYPKHWWEGTDEKGNKRDISRGTLEPPLGSGPYRVVSADPGRSILYQRVPDHWGATLNVNVGQDNFDQISYDYYRDNTVILEALKADEYDFRLENSARAWATGYENFPARDKGFFKLETFPDESSGSMQAYVVNLRRDKFKDQRVRRALNLAYDFEGANKATYYNLYFRNDSYFDGTELASSGLPQGLELEILQEVKSKFPDGFADSVFTAPYQNPVNGSDENVRANLREAVRLFKEAGYEIRGGKMVNAETSEPFTIEFLYYQQDADRQVQFWRTNLEKIGVTFNIRVVETSAYVERLRNFDYDSIIGVWGQSLSPGNEQRNYWGSASVTENGSRNYAGIAEPAIDALIDKIIFASERETLVAATRALDRVLLSKDFMVPQINYPFTRVAHWDRFGHPDPLPKYNVGFPTVWWFDGEKAARIVK
jgi:microcin C transport system substrate-binding protein